MAEALLVAAVGIAAWVVIVAMNAQAKARAFDSGDPGPVAPRPPEAVTNVELPSPQFNRRDPDQRRGKLS